MNTLLKKLSIILGILVFPIFSYANQISSSELNNQINKGNILSDSYNSLSECSTTKDGYNKEYSNYKRSECFLNAGKYYYFICELGISCMVNLSQTSGDSSQTTSNTNEEVPNKQRLDAFLSKIKGMKNEVKNDTKYEKMLIQLEGQLKVLGEKYRLNRVISQMVGYLGNGVENIKKDLVKNKDVDTFFCELTGNCENTNENTNENETTNTSTTGSSNNTSTNSSINNDYISLLSEETTKKMYTRILELAKNPPTNLEWRLHENQLIATYNEKIYEKKFSNSQQYKNFVDITLSYKDKANSISVENLMIRYIQTSTDNNAIGKTKVFVPKGVGVTMSIGPGSSAGGRSAYDTVLWSFGSLPNYSFQAGDDGYPYSVSHISQANERNFEEGKTFRSTNGYDWNNVIYNPNSVPVGAFNAPSNDWVYLDFVYATKIKYPVHPIFQNSNYTYHQALEIAVKDNPNINYSIDSGDGATTLDKSLKGISTSISLYNTKNASILDQLENIVNSLGGSNNFVESSLLSPTLTANKTNLYSGENIIFSWNANNSGKVEYCKYFINGQTDNVKLTGDRGEVPVNNPPIGNYILELECQYNNGQMKKSAPISIRIGEKNTTVTTRSTVQTTENIRQKTTFGILYTTLHCPMLSNNGLGVKYTRGDDLVYNNSAWPQAFYHWGKPELGHYCLTGNEGEKVLKKHAERLTNAGIDYIVIDSTNHAFTDTKSDRTNEMIIEPTKKLLQVWNTLPNAPKVAIWAPIVEDGDVYKILLQELNKYPNLQFHYKGKPLILNATDTARYKTDSNAIEILNRVMTVRDMWGLNGVGNKWQFMNPTGSQGPNNGEQISVSPAYQMNYMTRDSAVGKNNGLTFKSQFASVFANPGIDTVIISSWNEWASIRLQDIFNPAKAAYTDTFDENTNRDIEPQEGGKGDFYYQLMKKCISAYKNGQSSCE